jgi:hypothetical protein
MELLTYFKSEQIIGTIAQDHLIRLPRFGHKKNRLNLLSSLPCLSRLYGMIAGLAVALFKLGHETDQRLNGFEGNGIVNGGTDSSHTAVSF